MPSASRYKSSVLLMSVVLGVVGAIGSATQAQAASFTSFSRGLLPSYPWDDRSGLRERISGDGSTVIGARSTDQNSSGAFVNAYRWTQSDGVQLIGGPFLTEGSPFNPNYSSSVGVTTDGSVVVGQKHLELFQWKESGGTQTITIPDNPLLATGASADLRTIVGQRHGVSSVSGEAFRWSSVRGIQGLGYLPVDTSSAAYDASDDGDTVVGTSGGREAFRWTQSGGMQGLGYLPGNQYSRAVATSGDGLMVVGSSSGFSSSLGGFNNTAFRWTETGGMQSLGDLPGGLFDSSSFGISRDGSAVVGSSTSANGVEAFIWTQATGMQSVKTLLTIAGLDLTGWDLNVATDLSDDGLSIVGVGRNPNGGLDTWVARLDATPTPTAVPETTPITPLLAGLAALGISLGRKRNELI
jgi:uncharacterized membrane protein